MQKTIVHLVEKSESYRISVGIERSGYVKIYNYEFICFVDAKNDWLREDNYMKKSVLLILTMLLIISNIRLTYASQPDTNLLKNSDFANDEWWFKSGRETASLSFEKLNSTEQIQVGDTSRYAKISGRTEPWECIAQNITSQVIKSGKGIYEYSFYARLSDEYPAGVVRNVQLCTTKQDSNDSAKVYDSMEVTSNGVLVGHEWTKVSGTINYTWSGDLKMLLFKISEQGEKLKDGTYGSYYVTNATLKKQATDISIQENIGSLYTSINERIPGIKTGVSFTYPAISDAVRMNLVAKHFNSVTFGNEMKPGYLLGKSPNVGEDGFPILDFTKADTMVDKVLELNNQYGTDIKLRGHVLVWHSQTPEWFFYKDYNTDGELASKEVMLQREENYIKQVMNHYYGHDSKYKDVVYAWDVVNEAIDDWSGTLRTRGYDNKVNWYNIFKNDDSFVTQAFVYANRYAPKNVKLFYNDFNECSKVKCEGICKLLEKIKDIPEARISGMGMQCHYSLTSPNVQEFREAVEAYSKVVDEIQLTEIDMKTSDGGGEGEKEAIYTKQAYQYKGIYDEIVKLINEGINITAICFWGTDDGHSWLNSPNRNGGGNTTTKIQYPLLFDENYQAKPAYFAFTDPLKLDPQIKELVAVSADDYDQAFMSEFVVGESKVKFYPIWNKDGLFIKVKVNDTSIDINDRVEVFAEFSNDRTENAKIQSIVREIGTKRTAQGYEIILPFPSELSVNKKIAFDLRVTDGTSTISYNDLTNNQYYSTRNYASLLLKPYILINKGTACIDGKIDESWKSANAVILGIKSSDSVLSQSTAKILWDQDNLYVLFDVMDTNLDVSAKNTYEQDSVEIFIDEGNGKEIKYGEDDKQYRINCDNKYTFNGINCKEEYIQSRTTRIDGGYRVEAAIKWSNISPCAGDKIGLDLQINDGKDGRRLGTLNWYDSSGQGYLKPSVLGTATLKDVTKDESEENEASFIEPDTVSSSESDKPKENVEVRFIDASKEIRLGDKKLFKIAVENCPDLSKLRWMTTSRNKAIVNSNNGCTEALVTAVSYGKENLVIIYDGVIVAKTRISIDENPDLQISIEDLPDTLIKGREYSCKVDTHGKRLEVFDWNSLKVGRAVTVKPNKNQINVVIKATSAGNDTIVFRVNGRTLAQKSVRVM